MEDKVPRDSSPLVPCHITLNTRYRMTFRELHTINCFKRELRTGIDPICIASTLRRYDVLKESLYSTILYMFTQDTEREIISDFLLANISSCMNLEYFLQVLNECGYRKLACRIFLEYVSGGISYIHKSTSGQRPVVHKFFRNLKRMVHDAQFENPRLALRQLAERFIDQMQNESNQTKRQLLADKCIAIIGAEIDAIAITFDKRLHEHDVFKQMKDLVTETSNTSITDVVYLGRLANANSIAGNFDSSEDILVEARCRAYNTGPCLELVNMLYIEVYVKLWEFEKYPTQERRKQLMMWGRVGLESLENEDVDTKTLWRRMFILRMVFCLIGIGNRANIIEGCPIDEECLSQAGDLLSDIDRTWDGIEARRKMFYFVARARLSELRGNFSESVGYTKKARKLANEGHFEELTFIVKYYERIIKETKNQAVTKNHTDQSKNLVLLRKETGSCSNDNDHACILTATDESRNFVLLRTLSEESFTAEERYNVCSETYSLRPQGSSQSTYSPVAFDESRNLLLLKSLEIEIHNIHSDTSKKERDIELNEILHETRQEPLEQCTNQDKGFLLHSTNEGSVLAHDHETTSFNQTDRNTLYLYHTSPQVALKEQIILSDLRNPSFNYVLIKSDPCNSEESNFDILPSNQEILPELPPLRLCVTDAIQQSYELGKSNSLQENTTSCNHKLNVLFEESEAGSTDNVSTEFSVLIPANACQELPRYYLMQPETSTACDPLPDERLGPSGCSFENVSNIIHTSTDMKDFQIEKLNVANQEETYKKRDTVNEENDSQEWSFQSDDMFGD